MKLQKTLIASAILAASGTASADFIGIYAGAERWNYDLDGYVNSGDQNVDLNQDLGFKDSDDNTYYVAFEHPISKKATKIEAPLPKHMSLVWKHFGWKI